MTELNSLKDLQTHSKNYQTGDYETRYKFYIKKHLPDGFQKELSCLNFFVETPEKKGVQVENSWEIVKTFENVVAIFQGYMKSLTVENLYRNYDEFNLEEVASVPSPKSNVVYELTLTDCLNGEKVLYSTSVCGNDYIDSIVFFIPIWKDYEVNGEYKSGIRTTLKDLFFQKKYTDRFQTLPSPKQVIKNSFTLNSYESYGTTNVNTHLSW